MRLIGLVLMSMGVFAAAAAGAWYYKTRHLDPVAAEAETSAAPAPQGVAAGGEPVEEVEAGSEPSRTAGPVSVEEMVRIGLSLKDREQKIERLEEELRLKLIQQQIAFTEIQGEQQEIDGLRTEIRGQLNSAEGVIARLVQARQAVIEERKKTQESLKEAQSAQIEIDRQHEQNTKKLAQWMQSMDPDKASGVLKEMANNGEMATAAQVLSHLEEREAARILSTIDDAKLVQELVAAFRNLKNPKETNLNRGVTR